MTEDNEARARLLSHYMLKMTARKNELAALAAGLDRTVDPKLRMAVKTKVTVRTNEISNLEEKIAKLQQAITADQTAR